MVDVQPMVGLGRLEPVFEDGFADEFLGKGEDVWIVVGEGGLTRQWRLWWP